jgi:hypothetical protein
VIPEPQHDRPDHLVQHLAALRGVRPKYLLPRADPLLQGQAPLLAVVVLAGFQATSKVREPGVRPLQLFDE